MGVRVGRRAALGIGSTLLAGAAAAWPRRAASARTGATRAVIVAEGTNLAVAISPDGATIVFDLLGLLWTVPATGGEAQCLSDEFADLAQPSWSPDGRRIVFQSYRSGNFHIWSCNADGSDPRQHTQGFADHREPCVSPDGRSILFASDRTGRYAIHLLDLASGAIRQVTNGAGQESEPCFARDGRRIAYVVDGANLMVADLASDASPVERVRGATLHAPAFAPDGRLAYTRVADGRASLFVGDDAVTSGEDVFAFRPSWAPNGDLVYASDGKIRRLGCGVIPFTARVPVTTPSYRRRARDFTGTAPRPVLGIASPVLSPDGTKIAFCALNDVYVLTIGDPVPKRQIAGPFHKSHPAWSPDGRQLVYATDKAGTLDLWLHDLDSGVERQLTNLTDMAVSSCTWSQDGTEIAFLNQDGALHAVEVASGRVRKLYGSLWQPGRPSFAPGGRHVVCAAFKPVSARCREGLSEILLIDTATGAGRYKPIAPDKSIATRGDDGPVWSPDGTHLAYVFASRLWVQPVDAEGNFRGAPRQVTDETTDAPSWAGRTLLYLSNGRLRLVSIDGDAPRDVPLHLHWAVPSPPPRTVIAGARVWDGLHPGYRDADVVVEGGRIAALVARGSAQGARIDGTGLVLLPGLIDMHTHRQMQGYGYGDRMGRIFLSMGITATRSPGGPAYHAVEDREAVDARLRVAPRHFVTGEAIDGSRIYYNFMRPLTETGQMALELARAEALGYELLKTYVRLDHRTQDDVIRAAHRMGVSVASHYHYPALRNGGDCTEHLGATSRYGYARTASASGAGYDDVSKLFAAARAGRTPTLFYAGALLADDPALLNDPRIRLLFPPWEYARLEARMRTGDRAAMLAVLERNVQQIRDMLRLGWHVHSGTDAPIDLVAISLHLNLRAMVRFGISAEETLRSVTRHAGEFLHAPLGTIAPGQLADLILVEGDPLQRIEDLANVRMTMVGGGVHDVPSLLAPFERHAALQPSRVEQRRSAHTTEFWEEAAYVEEGRHACCAALVG